MSKRSPVILAVVLLAAGAGVWLFLHYRATHPLPDLTLTPPSAAPTFSPQDMSAATTLLDHGQLDQARELFIKIHQANPKLPAVCKFLGDIALRQNRPSEALAYYQQGLALAPKDPWLLLSLGHYYVAVGQPEQGVAIFLPLLKTHPNPSVVYMELGQAYQRLGKEKEAEAALRRATTLDKGSVWPLLNLARIYESQNREALAAAAYRQVLAKDKGNSTALKGLAYQALGREDKELAAKLLTLAMASDPRDPMIPVTLGQIHLMNKKLEPAKAMFDQAVQMDPTLLEARKGLIQLALLAGDQQEASRQRSLALKDHPEAARELDRLMKE